MSTALFDREKGRRVAPVQDKWAHVVVELAGRRTAGEILNDIAIRERVRNLTVRGLLASCDLHGAWVSPVRLSDGTLSPTRLRIEIDNNAAQDLIKDLKARETRLAGRKNPVRFVQVVENIKSDLKNVVRLSDYRQRPGRPQPTTKREGLVPSNVSFLHSRLGS